ncbi:fimbrial protein [Yersinia ruckeri]|nr:fimbrial protein [Yersinia ruckeri]
MYLRRFSLTSALLLSSTLAHSDELTIEVKFTVVIPSPCILNDGKIVQVDFGNDVSTKKVDGKNYSRSIPFNLVCVGETNNAMKFRIKGTQASFGGSNTLVTSNTNLGIAIEVERFLLAVPLNSDIAFTYPGMIPLQAVLVKRPGSTLRGGKFSAGATLSVDYQ